MLEQLCLEEVLEGEEGQMILALLIFIPAGLPIVWLFVHFSLRYIDMKKKKIEIIFEME